MKKNPIRILLADDHTVAREGIRSVLAQANDMEVVGEAANGQEAKQMVTTLLPDVLLLDLVMPDVKPFEVEEWVRENYPQVATLLITGHHRERFLARAVTNNSKGYLTKEQEINAFLNAIRKAARGESLITDEQIARTRLWQETIGKRWYSLTLQERDVLRQISTGANNLEIAEKLIVTVKTVESHITHIFRKLGVNTRAEAIAWIRDNFLDGLPE